MIAAEQPGGAGQQAFISYCTACHQVNGLQDAEGNPIINQADTNLVSGAAPNLTHLMSRVDLRRRHLLAAHRVLPQAISWLRAPEEFGAQYLAGRYRRVPEHASSSKEWLRNAPAKKPMYPTPQRRRAQAGHARISP